jgi:hypothetical protein
MSATIVRETGERVTFDATIRESHRKEARVTSHPVEDGVEISDHVQTQPRFFSLTVLISETPIETPSFRVAGARSGLTITEPTLALAPNRVQEIFDFLSAVMDDGEFVEVITPKFGLIPECLIVNMPLDISNINAGRFTISCRQIRRAELVTVSIPPLRPAPEAQAGAPDEVDVGQQPTEQLEEPVEEAEDTSILYGIAETFGFV